VIREVRRDRDRYTLSERNTIDGAVGLDVLDNRHQLCVHADLLFVFGDLLGAVPSV
jgi:hypothetical protein